ncbi:MAG TPA: RHS repeat-associated core domain-containing protein [Rhizomicrobium sp.]
MICTASGFAWGGTTAFAYDALGQAVQDRRIIGANTYTVAYGYDPAGNVRSATYPSGRIVAYTRDIQGRISGITTRQTSGSSAATVVSAATYKPFGPLASLSFGNGLGLTLAYDQDYQLTDIDTLSGATVVQDLTYGHDASGNITAITDHLTSGRTQAFGYDNLNRLASASGLYGSLAFTYDGVGNRLTNVVGGTTSAYAYPSTSNRLSTVTTGANVRSFSYASNGSISDDTRDATHDYGYTFNNASRLVTAKLNGTTVGSYLYNALEQRAAKTASGSTIQFVYDSAGHLIEEANASTGAAVREYIWLDDMPVGLVDDTGAGPVLYYIHADHLNRPQKITDASKAVVWDGVFDPFGNPASITGTIINPLRFPGQYQDTETALAQNWFRDYDAMIGRYAESDPLGLEAGVNTFAYALNNPTKWSDAIGLNGPPAGFRGPSSSSGPSCEEECEQQLERDEAQCRSLPNGTPSEKGTRSRCWESANARYGACRAKKPLPPLVTWRQAVGAAAAGTGIWAILEAIGSAVGGAALAL